MPVRTDALRAAKRLWADRLPPAGGKTPYEMRKANPAAAVPDVAAVPVVAPQAAQPRPIPSPAAPRTPGLTQTQSVIAPTPPLQATGVNVPAPTMPQMELEPERDIQLGVPHLPIPIETPVAAPGEIPTRQRWLPPSGQIPPASRETEFEQGLQVQPEPARAAEPARAIAAGAVAGQPARAIPPSPPARQEPAFTEADVKDLDKQYPGYGRYPEESKRFAIRDILAQKAAREKAAQDKIELMRRAEREALITHGQKLGISIPIDIAAGTASQEALDTFRGFVEEREGVKSRQVAGAQQYEMDVNAPPTAEQLAGREAHETAARLRGEEPTARLYGPTAFAPPSPATAGAPGAVAPPAAAPPTEMPREAQPGAAVRPEALRNRRWGGGRPQRVGVYGPGGTATSGGETYIPRQQRIVPSVGKAEVAPGQPQMTIGTTRFEAPAKKLSREDAKRLAATRRAQEQSRLVSELKTDLTPEARTQHVAQIQSYMNMTEADAIENSLAPGSATPTQDKLVAYYSEQIRRYGPNLEANPDVAVKLRRGLLADLQRAGYAITSDLVTNVLPKLEGEARRAYMIKQYQQMIPAINAVGGGK